MSIWRILLADYKKWLCDARMAFLPIISVFSYETVGKSMIRNSELMNCKLQILEPYLALNSSYIFVLIIPILFIIMMTDFPDMDGSFVWIIYRMGRIKWLLSQFLLSLICSMTVLIWVTLTMAVVVNSNEEFTNMWSDVTTKLGYYHEELTNNSVVLLITGDIYNHMTPIKAMAYCTSLTLLSMLVYSLILILGKIFNKRYLSFGICIGLIGVGGILQIMGISNAFIFPAANAGLMGRYSGVARTSIHSFLTSYIYFVIMIVVLFGIAIWGIRRKNLCTKL